MPLFEDFPGWKPVSRRAGIAWLVVYLLFVLYAALDRSRFLGWGCSPRLAGLPTAPSALLSLEAFPVLMWTLR